MHVNPGAIIGLYAKPGQAEAQRLLGEVESWLAARGYAPRRDAAAQPAPALAVVLGGDGTMLQAARRLAAAGTPILAVHLGTLGFLTSTPPAALFPSLEAVLAGRAIRQRRTLLQGTLERAGGNRPAVDAVNELAVRGALARMMQIEISVDEEAVGQFRADGVMVATPTGSTGYSYSAGGAVLHPALAGLIVTPICPHALNQRPLVVPAEATIGLRLLAPAESVYLNVDGQQSEAMLAGDRLVCRRSPYELTLVTATAPNFYQDLRTKLRWG